MGMVAPVYYTADQIRALPEDGNRYEVVHGELLVTPAPRALHQEVVRRLLVALSRYLEAEPVGPTRCLRRTAGAGADPRLGSNDDPAPRGRSAEPPLLARLARGRRATAVQAHLRAVPRSRIGSDVIGGSSYWAGG